jgi:hypothetical protein
MTPTKKKVTLTTIGSWAGSIVAVIVLFSYGWTAAANQVAEYIDNRIDCKMQLTVELLKQITTEDQQRKAAENVKRWEAKR